MEISDMTDSRRQLPLSVVQRDIWIDQQSFPRSRHLNVGGYGEIHGSVNLEFMAEAIRRIAAESEALRLIPISAESQTLIAEPIVELIEKDFCAEPNPAQAAREFSQAFFSDLLPLDDGRPPWRVALLQVGEGKVGMLTQFHHIVMDGWGCWLFYVRWGEHYTALCEGREPHSDPGRAYSEAIRESLEFRQSSAFATCQAYWKQKFSKIPEPLFEPAVDIGGDGLLPDAILHTHVLPREFYDRVVAFSEGMGLIPYQVFLAVMGLHFTRLMNRDDVVIGVPGLNRGGKRYKQTLGMFASVSPLRIRASVGLTGRELISEIVSELRDVYRRQRFPLSEIGRSLKILEQGRDRLFDVVLSFEKTDFQIGWGDMTGCEARQIFSGVARYPLVVTICEFEPDQDVELSFEASAAVFSAAEVELLGNRLHHLTERLIEEPDRALDAFDMVPQSERSFLLGDRLANPEERPSPTFVESFVRQAESRPQAPALVWTEGTLDYGEVDRLSSQWAQFLAGNGAGRDRTIAIAMDRGPEVVVSILAVAKAGAAFLLIDPDAPLARTKRMLEKIDAPIMLTVQAREARLTDVHSNCRVVDLQSVAPGISGPGESEHVAEAPAGSGGDDLAYVVFTSGSTGEPKGVQISHRGLSHRLNWLARIWNISPNDRAGQVTQLSFDPCLIEILLPLTRGAAVALPPPGRRSAGELASFFASFDVTYCVFVPTSLRAFLEAAEKLGTVSMRLACCGGDALPAELCERFCSSIGGEIYNLYGPSEVSIFVTSWKYEPLQSGKPVPLGRALEGVCVHVLDDTGRLLPVGCVGEIHLGGVGLTRGYLGRPDLDEQVFVADPFQSGARLYRSGDKGYIGADGNLYFLGRRDRQIKLRGYRIEPGEIESALQTHAQVDFAAVKMLRNSSRSFLHAWIVPSPAASISVENVLRHVRNRVCDHMVPSSISVIPTLPVISNGKIDFAALPEPQKTAPLPRRDGRPLTELERQVALLWEETLKTGPVTLGDDFFQLGGDSLSSVALLVRLESLTGHRYPLTLITEQPQLQDQVEVISRRFGGESLCINFDFGSENLPLLYVAASGNGDLLRIRNLAQALAGVCSVRMLQPDDNRLKSNGDFEKLSSDYAQAIRERMKGTDAPPPWIAGFSVGGIAALETVRHLDADGICYGGLILIDTVHPDRLWGGRLGWKLAAWIVRILGLRSLILNGRHLEAMFNDPGLNWQIDALRGYAPKPGPSTASLIASSGLAKFQRWFFKPWNRVFTKTLSTRDVPGSHGSIFLPTNVTALAETIRVLMGADVASAQPAESKAKVNHPSNDRIPARGALR
jgi:amino acid adenylation domain-containing protein